MSDIAWYSRLLVWVGAGVLIVEAVAGRSFGLLTPFAVLILSIGFIVFLATLMIGGRPLQLVFAEEEAPPLAEPARSRAPIAQEEPVVDVGQPEPVPPVGEEVAQEPAPAPGPQQPTRVATIEVVHGSPEEGRDCPRCGGAIASGQVAAVCPVCGRVHHASCWIENRFRCATAGCSGHGSLEELSPPAPIKP